jgi:hypothetical protein
VRKTGRQTSDAAPSSGNVELLSWDDELRLDLNAPTLEVK